MNIKQGPGRGSGYERAVNVEAGPMGAGAGAAAAIDSNVPSPRGAAIEKAQAELRRDLAAREERRRELDFLEKGGELLDFKFGEDSLVKYSPLSPIEAVVDGLLPLKSEDEGVHTCDVVIDGDLSNGRTGCLGAEEGLDSMSVALVPGNEQAFSMSSSLGVGAGDPSWGLIGSGLKTDVDSCLGRPRSGGLVNRSRVRSHRLGNGHAVPKELEGGAGGDRQVAERRSTGGPCTVENEGMVDMSYQVLPHMSQHALPGKWNGLSTSQEYEPVNEIMVRCGPVLEQDPSDHGSRDRASLSSLKSLLASDVRTDSRAGVTGRDSDRSSVGGERSPYQVAERADAHGQSVGVGERREGHAGSRQAEGVSSRDAGAADSARICGDDVGGGGQATAKRGAVILAGVNEEKSGDSAAGPREVSGGVEENHSSEARSAHDSSSHVPGDGSRGGSTQRDPRVMKKAGGPLRGGSQLRVARAGADEKRVSVHHVRLKVEDGVAEDRAKHLATQAEPGAHETIVAHSQELRTGVQAGAVVGGAPRSVGRPPNNSGTSNFKYPVPWVKGQDSAVQAEAERLREKLANKAREDFILEEAEHLKVKKRLLEERKTMKPVAEPARRKSHWDYVLEEMKWMANDFWQERMWKRYQAAHVCLEIAMKKGEDDFLAAELTREQHRVARILASAVKDFWHTAEVAVTKEKSDSRSSGQEQGPRRTGQSEVVPMDVDFPVTSEALEKPVRHEKGGKEQLIGVQKYAIQLLEEWDSLKMRQAEAPPTPERRRESNSILDQVREVPLLYQVPVGSMEAYRAAVEAEHARSEEEYGRRRAATSAEAEALNEAVDDASAGGDVGYAELSNDGGSQEDEPAIFTAGGSRISRKKRKKIFKTNSIGSRAEGSALQGLPYRAGGSLSSEAGIPSPLMTGKRSLTGGSGANSLPGSIPVKRARSSAANFRPRGTQPGTSPGGYNGQKGNGSQFQQDDDMDALDGLNEDDVSNDTPSCKGVMGDGRMKKKKQKTKPYPELSLSDGGTAADTPAKNSDEIAQEFRQEQMKRKADTHSVFIGGADAGLDTPGTPGSQGTSGQQNPKKQKSVRQAETNSEAAQAGQQAGSVAGVSKLLRQSSLRDRNRRVRPAAKVPFSTPTGGGIPWSAGEDQAILALVHDLGANWDLVSDVLSSNSQIKGICRKPQQCKERHKALTERAGLEGLENTEDPSSSQPQASKGNMRGQRGQSAAEEDFLKHFEQIVIIVQKYGARKNSQSESEDQKVLQAPHSSHGIIMSQFWTGIGGTSNPVDLADRVTGSEDPGPHPHPAQAPQGNVLGPPIAGPMAGLGMRPPAGGLPLVLPGPNGLHGLGQGSLSPAAMSATAARDAQRLNMSSFSNDDHARLQMVTKQLSDLNARRAQQQAVSAAAGVPVLGGLSNLNGLPMLSTSTSGGMLVGMNRGLSLPRPGLAGMGSPVVSSMGTAGLSGRLPPSGNLAASSVSRRIAGLVNMARSAGCTEEQRLQALQQLQSMAQQGDGQAAAALVSLTGGGGGDMGNPVDALNQPFSLHHQHPLQQQHQQQSQEQHQQLHQQQLHHLNNTANKLQAQVQQHGHQVQLSGAPQAYLAVPTRMKEQQQQQLQRQQQQQQQQQLHKQKLLGNLPPNPQPQHMLVPPHQAAAAAAVASLPGQHLKSQPHILPPQQHNSLQKQLMQQVGSPSQGAQLSVASSSLQSSPASSGNAGQQSTAGLQNERPGQMPQGSLAAAKPPQPPQPNQSQKQVEQTSQMMLQQQQQAMRNSKGVSRGAMLMQGSPAQAAQTSSFPGGGFGQSQGGGGGQVQAGQRVTAQAQAQSGKAGSGGQAGNPGGAQPQSSQVQGAQPQIASSMAGGQKGGQQQSAQGGVGKEQRGGTSQAPGLSGGQQAAPASASVQQLAAAASSSAPNQLSQQVHRRQVTQAQPPRRSQAKHSSTSMGAAVPGQQGQTGAQAVPPQMPQAGQSPYQLGGATGSPNQHGMTLSSALNSSTAEAHSTQWRSNQTLPSLGGGIYNLTRGGSPGAGQSPAMMGAGLHSNGNVGAPSLSSTGVQGVGGVASQKLGAGPGVRGREPQVGAVGNQRSSPVPLPSGAGNMASHQARPPPASSASASRLSSGGAAVSQGGTSGATAAPTASSGQARQARVEHAALSATAPPPAQRAAIPGASGSRPSDTSNPGAPSQGGPAPRQAAAPSSS